MSISMSNPTSSRRVHLTRQTSYEQCENIMQSFSEETTWSLYLFITKVKEFKIDNDIAFGMLDKYIEAMVKEEEPSPHHPPDVTDPEEALIPPDTSTDDEKHNDNTDTENIEFQQDCANILGSDPQGNKTNFALLNDIVSNLKNFVDAPEFIPHQNQSPTPPPVSYESTVMSAPNRLAPIVEVEEEECMSPTLSLSFPAATKKKDDQNLPAYGGGIKQRTQIEHGEQMNGDREDTKEQELQFGRTHNENENEANKPDINQSRQWTPQQQQKYQFRPKLPNAAKGNFYITKQTVLQIIQTALERFDTDTKNDEKLAFCHIRESIALQINDGQINVLSTVHTEDIIVIHIDLHFSANGEIMYLVAVRNDPSFRARVPWKIMALMTKQQILSTYGVLERDLPISSRLKFMSAVQLPPIDGYLDYRDLGIFHINFKILPHKYSKRRSGIKNQQQTFLSVPEKVLQQWVERSFLDKEVRNTPIVPVVVIKGKQQFIEWKKFVRITDNRNRNRSHWFAISLRFMHDQWRITCLDFDAGRIYYQHRLLQLNNSDRYCYSYSDLIPFVNISSLKIC